MIVIGSRILPQHNKRAEQSVRSKIIKFGGERERERERERGRSLGDVGIDGERMIQPSAANSPEISIFDKLTFRTLRNVTDMPEKEANCKEVGCLGEEGYSLYRVEQKKWRLVESKLLPSCS